MIRVTIQTEPVPKSRPRTVFKEGKVRTYTPTKTIEAQDFIKYRLLRHRDNAFPAHVPIKLTATFFRTKSKYLPKKETKPFRKPDLDNFVKTLLDSLDVLVPDDAQVTTMILKKRWSSNGKGSIVLKLENDREVEDGNEV